MAKNNCVQVLKYALDSLELSNQAEVNKWFNYTNENINILTLVKESTVSLVKKQKLEDGLVQLEKYKLALSQIIQLFHADTRINFGIIIWKKVESAFNSRIQTGVLKNIRHKDPKHFLFDASKGLIMHLESQLKEMYMMKVTTLFSLELKKLSLSDENKLEFSYKHIHSSSRIIDQGTNLFILSRNIQKELLKKLEKSQEVDSGWTISEIISLTGKINDFTPLAGSSLSTLPPEIVINKLCKTGSTKDHACFAWSIVGATYKPPNNSDVTLSYPNYNTILDMNGISNPIKLTEIATFEKNNVISVNVFLLQRMQKRFKFYPIRLTADKQAIHVNLLMVHEHYFKSESEFKTKTDFNDMKKFHFCWIKNLTKLIVNRIPTFAICDRCLRQIRSEYTYRLHILECNNNNNIVNVLQPRDNKWLSFQNYCNKERAPYIIYAATRSFVNQSFLENLNDDSTTNCEKHEIFSIGYYFLCSYDSSLNYYKSYRGENACQWFADELKLLAENMEATFICKVPEAKKTPELELKLKTQTHCYICGKIFNEGEKIILINCDLTGNAKGMAHFKCLTKYDINQTSQVVSVIFHNMNDEESDCIPKKIFSHLKGYLNLLPFDDDRFIGFTNYVDDNIVRFRFIDSYCYLPSQLNELISICNNLTFIKDELPNYYSLMGKHLPHDCFNNWSNLDEKQLPLENVFSNRLCKGKTSRESYNYAQNIWSSFKLQTMGDYSDLYLKCDIMSLVEVFEEFRNICLNSYYLDPTHYFTPSEFSWDAMLKYTNIKLQPIADPRITVFIERGLQPALLIQCNGRYSKANNSYMNKFDVNKNEKFLMYLNVNNLYEWAFSQYLPASGFRWMTETEIENFNIDSIPDDNINGFILEVDLEYPQSAQKKHKQFPFFQGLKSNQQTIERYVVHYRTLQQFTKNEIELKRIHQILEFVQAPWLRKYIDLNIALRVSATNQLEKNIYSLMNICLISNGKTFENTIKSSYIKLMKTWHGLNGAKNCIAKENFLSSDIIDENLVAIRMLKKRVEMEKPYYLRQAIFAIAKINIYEFHYEYMANLCLYKGFRLLYIDANTLIYEFQNHDFYKFIRSDIQKFTTGGYPTINRFLIPSADKILPGFIKDILNGKIMTEYVGNGPKMYSIKVDNNCYMDDINERKDLFINRSIDFDTILKSD